MSATTTWTGWLLESNRVTSGQGTDADLAAGRYIQSVMVMTKDSGATAQGSNCSHRFGFWRAAGNAGSGGELSLDGAKKCGVGPLRNLHDTAFVTHLPIEILMELEP
jgi:hypothetical protein